MRELKDHLYFLLANNIEYNRAYDVFAATEDLPNMKADPVSNIFKINDILHETDNHRPDDEDFYINVLTAADVTFLIYGACFCLTVYGTKNSLPALVMKLEIASEATIREITSTIYKIAERTGLNQEQLKVLQNPAYRKINWNKSAMSFFCQYSALIKALNLDMEDPRTIAMGDFLRRELNVELDGHDSIDSYRVCHMDTEAYFKEMRCFDKSLRSEDFLSKALVGTGIMECQESKLTEVYQEFMNEFLNVRLVQEFGKEQFRS